jgi:tetratricopeptide (TPR) repeat protein
LTLCVGAERRAQAEAREQPVDQAANRERERAEELYQEGAALLGAGRYWEAELRFQESWQLLKGRGTLLNLAICHENLGRLATAWRELKSLEEQAIAAGDTPRLQAAREHLAWTEPQLSYLNVNSSPEAGAAGVQVELDGEPLPTLGGTFPVDPGRHQLRASAPGKKTRTIDLVFQNGSQRQNVTIPNLEDADGTPAIPAVSRQAPPRAPAAQNPAEVPVRADYSGVYVAGAVTLTLTAGAIASAFAYYDRRSAYHEAITNPEPLSAQEQSARRQSADRMAWINGSLIVSAGVGAAVTGFLWYRAAQAKQVRASAGAWVAPLIVGSGAGLQLGAKF